jgi:hypothetical protein
LANKKQTKKLLANNICRSYRPQGSLCRKTIALTIVKQELTRMVADQKKWARSKDEEMSRKAEGQNRHAFRPRFFLQNKAVRIGTKMERRLGRTAGV